MAKDRDGTIEALSKAEEEAVIKRLMNAEKEKTELELDSLKPKRDNWDLKRSLEREFKILDQRTDRAIIDIVRQRILGQEQNIQDK